MKPRLWTALFLAFASVPGFADTWSGALVDSKCFEAEERNISPTSTLGYVNRDKDLEIRLCYPKPKTKDFAVVDFDGMLHKLDPAGNAKAAELARTSGRRPRIPVTVIGEMSGKVVKVDSISVQPEPAAK